MKILYIITGLSILSWASCTKQTQQITETLGDTTGEIVSNSVDSIITVDSANADTLTVFQKNIKKYEDQGRAIAMYEGGGKTFKATFRADAEGSPVLVLSEGGKDLPWMYQTSKNDSVAVYKGEGLEFTMKGNTAVLVQKGKTFNLTGK